MKVVCVKLNSGEEIIGKVVAGPVKLVETAGNGTIDRTPAAREFEGDGPWDPSGKITLELVRGITAQQVGKNEMAIGFFPWSLANTDGKFTIDLDRAASAIYSAEKNIEDGYIEQVSPSGIKLARGSLPGIKM